MSSSNTLRLYRGLLRALRYYPSQRKDKLAQAIKEDFRKKRDLEGSPLERALWLAEMELKRLQAWEAPGRQVKGGEDVDVKL